jgi:hypothetical protein
MPVRYQTTLIFRANTDHTVAIFRQINKGTLHTNHDALEFPDGEIVLLTRLCEGQKATVLTLPPHAKTAAEVEAQQRVAYDMRRRVNGEQHRPPPSRGGLLPSLLPLAKDEKAWSRSGNRNPR